VGVAFVTERVSGAGTVSKLTGRDRRESDALVVPLSVFWRRRCSGMVVYEQAVW
jgi:hypothetical protein